MSELIRGKEAKLAWANGQQLELKPKIAKKWLTEIKDIPISVFDSDFYEFRLKPRAITINGIEVPAPFEPKNSESAWVVDSATPLGYRNIFHHSDCVHFMCWRTEEEIKQVVAALRSIFNKN